MIVYDNIQFLTFIGVQKRSRKRTTGGGGIFFCCAYLMTFLRFFLATPLGGGIKSNIENENRTIVNEIIHHTADKLHYDNIQVHP